MLLNVMSFNLRTDTTQDKDNAWPYRKEALVHTIRQAKPGILGTQEGLSHMVEQLQDLLPDYAWVGQPRHSSRSNEHCALFHSTADIKLLEHGTFWLSESPNEPGSIGWGASYPRICTWAQYASAADDKRQWRVYNLHLDHKSEQARLEGIKLAWRTIVRHHEQDGLPFIIMGDFNTEPNTAPLDYLSSVSLSNGSIHLISAYDHIANNSQPIGRTFHEFEGGIEGDPIDYLFVSSDISIVSAAIIRDRVEGRYPSDHYPISCTLQL